MPLIKSGSKESIGKNIKILKSEGYPTKQAQAIALDISRKHGGKIKKK